MFLTWCCVSIAVRQTGILLLIAGFISALVYFRSSKIMRAWTCVGLIVGLAFYFSLNAWVKHSFNPNPSFVSSSSFFNEFFQGKLLPQIFYRTGTILLLCGLFLLPITLPLFRHAVAKYNYKQQIIRWLMVAPFIVSIVREFTFFPHGNVFYAFGTGPLTLKDQLIEVDKNAGIALALGILQFMAFLGGLILLFVLVHVLTEQLKKTYKWFSLALIIVLFVVMLCGSFFVPVFFFDRYVIVLLLPVLLLFITHYSSTNTILKKYIWFLPVFYLFFSVLSMKTYFEWNSARWKGLDWLVKEKGISKDQIDGGFEFNGFHQTAKVNSDPGKSWWFVKDDVFVVSFQPLNGYSVIRQLPYTDYISFKPKNIFVLKRNN